MKKIIVILASIIIIVLIAFGIFHHKKTVPEQTQNKTPPIPVRVQKPFQQTLSKTASATGYLIAQNSTIITPRASGYIRAIDIHEGEAVKSEQILFQLDNQTEKEALTAAKANYSLSQLQHTQDAKLIKKGYVTHDAFDTSKATLKQNQAALQTAQKNLQERTITAPFDGTVGALPVSLGDYVNPGDTLTTLTDNIHLRVEYALPAKELNNLKLNQTVRIADSTKQNHAVANVSYISPRITQATQTISVHAHVNNAAQLFKPGEYVSIMQSLGSQKNTLLVPSQSVFASINGYHIFIAKKNKAVKVPVKIGERIGDKVVITAGIKSTDNIIVAGENEVKDGVSVSVSVSKNYGERK